MTQILETVGDLIAATNEFREDKRWRYRGQADVSWDLVPKAGRKEYKRVDDKWIFQNWKKMAVSYHTNTEDDWDWLAIAQHHGLATRLLDWATSPLTAAFFASCENIEQDGVIFAAHFTKQMPLDEATPFKTKFTGHIKPRGVVQRILRQGGSFTYHAEPAKTFKPDGVMTRDIRALVIPKAAKREITSHLAFLGINRYSLFPDLDGLCAFTNWSVTSGEYWRL